MTPTEEQRQHLSCQFRTQFNALLDSAAKLVDEALLAAQETQQEEMPPSAGLDSTAAKTAWELLKVNSRITKENWYSK
tara:strand:+ start:23680 stop:23913 length:234 start_codon:yes stop_codon:yes gene_type:complete